MANAMGRLDVPRALKMFADWTDRIAPANCRPRSRRGRRAASATSSSRSGTGPIRRHICTMKCRPTIAKPAVNPNGKVYGATEAAPTSSPCSIRRRTDDRDARCRCAVRKTPTLPPTTAWRLRPTGGKRVDLDRPGQRPQPDARSQGPGLVHVSRRALQRTGLLQARAPPILRRSCSPIEQSTRHLSMYDPKTGKITLIRTCFPHAPSGVRRGCRQYAVDQRRWPAERRDRLARPARSSRRPVTRPSPRAGRLSFLTPTATASATRTMSSRTSRSIRPRTSASPVRSTASASIRSTIRCGDRC